MAEFTKPKVTIVDNEINKVETEKVLVQPRQNICVVSITNSNPYDISELPNNATTFYTNISYSQLEDLYHVLEKDSDTQNMLFKNILNHVKDPNTKVFFDFKCSSDCHSGSHFIDSNITNLVFVDLFIFRFSKYFFLSGVSISTTLENA
jgi:hypothetical protein